MNPNIPQEKKEIRVRLIQMRNALSEADCLAKSRAIEKRVLAFPEFTSAKTIQFYLSRGFEAQTDRLIQQALKLGKRVFVPVLSEKQPTLCESVDSKTRGLPEEVDLWILPAVACDTMGNRLGRGGGYYDRLLAGCVGRRGNVPCEGRTPKIVCLVFEFQIVDALPFEKTDRSVDMIITETRTIICGEK
jgi:5-formyltetrahydrofolate cyclo-ligase